MGVSQPRLRAHWWKTDALLRLGVLARAQCAQRRRGCSLIKMAPCLAYDFCPPSLGRGRGVAWTILRAPFSRSKQILRSCVASGAREPEQFESFWLGQPLKSPGNPAKMALSPEDKYRFALRVIGFACTTFYVFIYGFCN